jgi:2-dehydro-3-deoxyphosphogluconate aldolase/(4S)-4-hydroxy-2-oxoglutarate aldolase
MSSAEVLRAIGVRQALGVLRKCPREHSLTIAAAAVDAGLDVLEITLDSDDAIGQIHDLVVARPHAIVGAGTVHSVAEVEQAANAGVQFIVSPILSEAVIARALELGVVPLPGVATPTEMARAIECGAPAVKFFPAAQLGGPAFVAAVVAPMRGIKIIPTGGVDLSNARQYLDAGSYAIGIGGSLFTTAALRAGDTSHIERSVREFLQVITL